MLLREEAIGAENLKLFQKSGHTPTIGRRFIAKWGYATGLRYLAGARWLFMAKVNEKENPCS